MPALFADECIHTDLIVAMRNAGFDVLTAREAGLIGQMSKEEIISITLNFLLLPERTDLQGKLAIIGKSKIRIAGR